MSDASRTDAHGGNSRGELQAAVAATEKEYDDATAYMRDLQARLAELNAEVRGSQRLLPAARYRWICEEQQRLKQESAEWTTKASALKRRLKAMQADLHDLTPNAKATREDVLLLRAILKELRAIRAKIEPNTTEPE